MYRVSAKLGIKKLRCVLEKVFKLKITNQHKYRKKKYVRKKVEADDF
jgi:hypothetical protein